MHVQMHPKYPAGNTGKHVGKVGIMAVRILNGMSANLLSGVSWRKSRHSGAVGNCVEVATLETGEIAMRNSRFPAGPALVYTREEISAFIAGAKDGEFDDVLH
jgi:hypothetical protein